MGVGQFHCTYSAFHSLQVYMDPMSKFRTHLPQQDGVKCRTQKYCEETNKKRLSITCQVNNVSKIQTQLPRTLAFRAVLSTNISTN